MVEAFENVPVKKTLEINRSSRNLQQPNILGHIQLDIQFRDLQGLRDVSAIATVPVLPRVAGPTTSRVPENQGTPMRMSVVSLPA